MESRWRIQTEKVLPFCPFLCSPIRFFRRCAGWSAALRRCRNRKGSYILHMANCPRRKKHRPPAGVHPAALRKSVPGCAGPPEILLTRLRYILASSVPPGIFTDVYMDAPAIQADTAPARNHFGAYRHRNGVQFRRCHAVRVQVCGSAVFVF